MVKARQGHFWLGVAELATANTSAACNVSIADKVFNKCPTTSYGLRIITLGCYFYDSRNDAWHSSGMEASTTTCSPTGIGCANDRANKSSNSPNGKPIGSQRTD